MSRKRRSRRRNRNKPTINTSHVAKAVGAFLFLLVIFFVIGTRSVVLKPLLLSKIGGATNLQWECDSLSYWPTSGFTLKNAKARDPKFKGEVFKGESITVDSPGFVIFKKEIKLSKFEAKGLSANIITLEDGSSNLDNFKKSFVYRQPLQNDLRDFSLKNIKIEDGSISWVEQKSRSERTKKGISNINLNIPEWGRGKLGKFDLEFTPHVFLEEENQKIKDEYSCRMKVNGAFKLNSKGSLIEASLKGESEPAKGTGIFASSNRLNYKLDATYENDLLSSFLISVNSPEDQAFRLSSSGKLDLVKIEANQIINYSGSLSVLNPLIGDEGGYFSKGIIQGKSTFFAKLFGNSWMTTHEVKADQVTFNFKGSTLPVMNAAVSSRVALEKALKSFRVDTFDLEIDSGKNNTLNIYSEGATNFSYGPNRAGFEPSTIKANIKSDLRQWRNFLPEYIKGGQINLAISAIVMDDGKKISWTGESNNSNIILQSQNDPSIQEDYNIDIKTNGPINELKVLEHGIFEVSLLKNSERKAYSKADLLYLGKSRGYNILLDIGLLDLSHLSRMVPIPYVDKPEGDLRITTSYSTVEKNLKKWSMNFDTRKLGGKIFGRRISDARIESGFTLHSREKGYSIPNATFDVRFGPRLALSLAGNLTQNYPQNTMDGNINILSFNQEAAMMLMPPWLKGMRIVDLSLRGKTKISSKPKSNDVIISSEIELEKFRNRGFTRVDHRTLPFDVKVEARYFNQEILIRSANLNFSPNSPKEDNQLSLSKPIALQFDKGQIRRQSDTPIILSSDQLEITQWINFFDQWRQINGDETLDKTKIVDPPLNFELNVGQFYNGSKFIENWKGQSSFSDLAKIPDNIAKLLPEKD